MNNKLTETEMSVLIDKAVEGDKKALETIISSVSDLVFNLSLRTLGTFHDAEDAAQDIFVKIITNLSSFRKESAFSTWVFRISVNHLKSYKKHMFANAPLSFEFYGADIENGKIDDVPDMTQGVEKTVLSDELKMSCTNVMLQCLDTESRCIFILGTMFKLDSRIAGEVLEMTAEAYRQRLSRIRRKVADFLGTYCGEYGGGKCRCMERVNYAIQNHRINPAQLDYANAEEIPVQTVIDFTEAMEEIDDLSQSFGFCKTYKSTARTKKLIEELLNSKPLSVIKNS